MDLAKEQKAQKINLILIYILSVDLIITLVAKFNGLFSTCSNNQFVKQVLMHLIKVNINRKKHFKAI